MELWSEDDDKNKAARNLEPMVLTLCYVEKSVVSWDILIDSEKLLWIFSLTNCYLTHKICFNSFSKTHGSLSLKPSHLFFFYKSQFVFAKIKEYEQKQTYRNFQLVEF